MALLVSLSDMKTYLGISGTTYDAFLTEQLTLVSSTVENYCGRIFTQGNYVQTFYEDDYCDEKVEELFLYHFPLITLTSVIQYQDATVLEDVTTTTRPHKPTAQVKNPSGLFGCGNIFKVTYTAGYATIPVEIQAAVKEIVQGRYNKKVAGVDLNFGSDVQSISIPGSISVAFDYSLQTNDRKSTFGVILGNYANVLDYFRSERAIAGKGRVEYVA